MNRLNVSNIQHFSVGDGGGIRTTLFLKGCNLRCPWCHNPETISSEPLTLVYPETGMSVSYGIRMSAEELFGELIRDKDFYDQSGGGVTVSGGEPLLQSKALFPLLKMLKESGIHVIIDTAGSLPWCHFEDVLELTDCFFVDLKSPRPEVYRDIVGGSLDSVIENLRRLTATGKELHVRIPVIPTVNDSPSDAEAAARLLMSVGIKNVDLLPFHRLGSGKYRAMGLDYAFGGTEPPSRDKMESLAEIYRRYFSVTVEN